jgi:hypothetical protein
VKVFNDKTQRKKINRFTRRRVSFYLNTKSLSSKTFLPEFALSGKSVSWYGVSGRKRTVEQFVFYLFIGRVLIPGLSSALPGKATFFTEKNHQEKYNKGGQQWIH